MNFPPPLKYTVERKAENEETEEKNEYKIEDSSLSFLDEIPITSGYRYSTLGYTDIPEVAAFTKDPLFEIFSNKKDQKNLGTGMKFEDIWLKSQLNCD